MHLLSQQDVLKETKKVCKMGLDSVNNIEAHE